MSAAMRAVEQTRRRLTVLRVFTALCRFTPLVVLVLTPFGVAFRLGLVPQGPFWAGILLVAAGAVFAVLRLLMRRPSPVAAALLLDRSHGFEGRLSGALDFSGAFTQTSQHALEGEDPYRQLGVRQLEVLGPLSPRRAAPLLAPEGWWIGALMTSFFLALALLPMQKSRSENAEPALRLTEPEERWLSEDDAELLQKAAQELEAAAKTEEGRQAAERFNEIVLRASRGELSQEQAFRLASELTADLEGAGKESEQFHEGLRTRGASLEKRDITSTVGRAMREGRYKDAEEALRALAERLRSEQEPLSERELQQLRESLEQTRREAEAKEKAESEREQEQERSEAELREAEKRLLEKKGKEGLSAAESNHLERTQRELERLDRRKKEQQSADQALSELDRQLAEAARELQSERQKSGEFLDQAAETMQRGTKQKLSDAEKKQLLEQLKALKERLRNAKGDPERQKRMQEFLRRARGDQAQGGPDGEGKPGQPGAGEPGGPVPGLGPGTTSVTVPDPKKGAPGDSGQKPGAGQDPGHAHDPQLTGEAERLKNTGHDIKTAVSQDTGEGQSASETILSAAEEGFVSGTYEKLFREYEAVAEEVMEKDGVPPGREEQVLRYFELIRPRKTQGHKEK